MIDTRRSSSGSLSRRRRCLGCKQIFTTVEHLDAPATAGGLMVRLDDGSLVSFDLQKVRAGILEALARPGGTDEVVDAVVARAGKRLSWRSPGRRSGEITVQEVEQYVLEELTKNREIYAVSRIRYALGLRGLATRPGGLQTVSQVKAWLKDHWPYGEPEPRPEQAGPARDRPLMVRKRSPRGTEDWTPAKLERSIAIAARGRDQQRRTTIVELGSRTVREQLSNQSIVTSGQVATKTMDVLRRLDPVSYLRYASAAKGFRQAREFLIETEDLEREGMLEGSSDTSSGGGHLLD